MATKKVKKVLRVTVWIDPYDDNLVTNRDITTLVRDQINGADVYAKNGNTTGYVTKVTSAVLENDSVTA